MIETRRDDEFVIVSNGMLLSEREMALGTDQDGIMELATDAEPGANFIDALKLADTLLDLDVTANRPDLGRRIAYRPRQGDRARPARLATHG